MDVIYFALTFLFLTASVLPFFPYQHWIFRIFDFARIQMLVIHLILLAAGFFLVQSRTAMYWFSQGMLLFFIVNNSVKLIPYTRFYPVKNRHPNDNQSGTISILSVNVYQFNKQHQRLIDLVREISPDILLTMESNQEWEKSLSVLDKEYKHIRKIARENTYGMHFYCKLKVNGLKVNYFTADDIPSVEAEIETRKGEIFKFFGIHPPPPSPTEEETSKERDGELLSIARIVRDLKCPALVTGDFNNVAWAKSSVLFRKTSRLIDPRVGRGFLSTFHADYRFFRFPIDLFFHSTDIFVEEFKTLPHIGSDHLPLFCSFYINHGEKSQEEQVEDLKEGEFHEVNEMIAEGKQEKSDRPKAATGEKQNL